LDLPLQGRGVEFGVDAHQSFRGGCGISLRPVGPLYGVVATSYFLITFAP
jgi:hypothetical protein